MEYRKLGTSELNCSVITFGAWAIGGWKWGGTNRKEAVAAIRAAYDAGVTSIDTAPAYGQGLSEEIVAEALEGIPREKVQIITKFGLRWDTDKGAFFFKSETEDGRELIVRKYAAPDSVVRECEDSLRRLRTDYIDLYQIHWHDAGTPIEDTMEAVLRLQEQGKIRQAGVCNYTPEWMAAADKVISQVSNQVPYSMLLRDIEAEVVPWCREHQKSVIAYSPLQRGILTGKMRPGYPFSPGDHRKDLVHYTDENIRRTNTMLDNLKALAADKGATLAQLVLRWTIDQPGITIALAGARNPRQAVQNAGAADIKLTTEELEFMREQAEKLQLEPA